MKSYWTEFYSYHEQEREGYYRLKEELHVMATVRTYFQFAFEVRFFFKHCSSIPDVGCVIKEIRGYVAIDART